MDDISGAKSAIVWCAICNIPLRENRYQMHVDRFHSGAVYVATTQEPQEKVRCPECGVPIGKRRLKRHISKVHGLPLPRFRGLEFKPPQSTSTSSCVSSMEGLPKISRPDVKLVRMKIDETSPIGLQVLAGINEGARWTATQTETCETCRRRIVFLDIGGGKLKAFDVDRNRNILYTHCCEERSESIFAFQAGIVDSNRRRH